MKAYFLSLLLASIIGALASALSSGGALEKYVKYIAALIGVIIIVSPLKSVFGNITSPIDISGTEQYAVNSSLAEDFLKKTHENDLSAYIDGVIFAETGIKPQTVVIQMNNGNEAVTVTVTLSANDKKRTEEVRKCVRDTLGDVICKVL